MKNYRRLETDNIYLSHETNGKEDLRTRSGIASELLFYFKPLSIVALQLEFNKIIVKVTIAEWLNIDVIIEAT